MTAEVLDGTGRWISAAISYSNSGSFLLLAVETENAIIDVFLLYLEHILLPLETGNWKGQQIQPVGNKQREHQ